MKRVAITIAVLVIPVGLAFARLMFWPHTKPPPLTLPQAYVEATQALGSATNEFYCVSANAQIAMALDGEWLFSFCSTNGGRKDVVVAFDKNVKPKVVDGGIWRY
jgi:hypothetical protein